jgi:ABC-type transport system involved in multi-copper enzyme maturation permease subunit
MLIVLAVVAALFVIISGCLFGSQLYAGGNAVAGEQQLDLARDVAFYMAVGWGVLYAVMLAMSAAARPLEDGRAAFLLAKPVRRSQVLFGQLLGVYLTALATVVGLGLIASVLSVIRAHAFPATLWLALAVSAVAYALVAAFVAFLSMFVPRIVAGLMGIILYALSMPAASSSLRDFMTGGYREAGLNFPWYVRWGSEVYFAAVPPVAGVQVRAAELLKMNGWGFDAWMTLATAAVYVVVFAVATWALYARRDV